MKQMASVFKYNVWEADENGKPIPELLKFMQTRLVVAYTEEEAESKMEAYNEELKDNGFCGLFWIYVGVEIDYVII